MAKKKKTYKKKHRFLNYIFQKRTLRQENDFQERALPSTHVVLGPRDSETCSHKGTARLKRDGTRAETRFRFSPKGTSPFKSAGASVQSNAGSRGVRIGGSNAGYTTFRGSVKSTGYPLHSPVFPSLPLPCVTVCHQVSNALYIAYLLFVTERQQSSLRSRLRFLHNHCCNTTNSKCYCY